MPGYQGMPRPRPRSVARSYVYGGALAIGRPLDEHVGFLIEALKPIAADAIAAARGGRVLVIATEWPEFAKLDLDEVAAVMADDAVIVDTRNLLDPAAVRAAGLRYDGVGRP